MIFHHLNHTEVSSSVAALNALTDEVLDHYQYPAYIASNVFKLRTEIYSNHYENRCQQCGKVKLKGLTLHHKTYKTLGQESCGDLLLVCKKCHYKIHQNDH